MKIININTKQTYVKLLEENLFKFAESFCYNKIFNKKYNNEQEIIYIPVQDIYNTTHIISVNPHTNKVDHIVFIDDVTIYGSKLSDNGIMYLCAYDLNKIIVLDIVNKMIVRTYNVPCPNDLCIRDDYIYVCAGTTQTDFFFNKINNPTIGQVVKIDTKTGKQTVILSNLNTLAGINSINNILFISQLYNVIIYDIGTNKKTYSNDIIMDLNYYLADNVSVENFDIYISFYRKLTLMEGHCLKSKYFSSITWTISKCISDLFFSNNKKGNKLIDFTDAEVDLIFSDLDKFKYPFYTTTNMLSKKNKNVIGNIYYIIPTDKKFDGHCTQIGSYNDFIFFLNFKSNKLLFIKK